MTWKGNLDVGATISHLYGTADQSGTAADGASGTIRVYKDASNTQRSSTVGQTHTRPYDTLTGLALVSIDTSDDTDAGFYAAGHDYAVVLVTETIDGQSVTAPLFSFSILNRAMGGSRQLTESYAADGVAPTLDQALFAIQQFLQEKVIVGTTLTVRKLDGVTAAQTFTLNDAAAPTSITRAT